MEERLIETLRESDLTLPLLCQRLDEHAENLFPMIQTLMIYGRINPNEKVIMYGKAGDLWFTISRRTR